MKRILSTFVASASFAVSAALGVSAQGAGDVLWHFEVSAPPSQLHRPSIGTDGTIYWSTRELYAINPSGQELWSRPQADPNPVGIGFDGTLYVGGWQAPPNDYLPALKAFAPDGTHLWDFTDFGLVLGFIGGPNVGPDGNVYGVMFDGFDPEGSGIGAFSLTPAGSLRWHFDGFDHLIAGTVPSEIEFGDGQMYKAESHAPMPAGEQQSGLIALELDGDVAFQASYGVPSNSPSRQPRVSPLNGNVHLRLPSRTIRTFRPDGSQAWVYTGPYTPTGFGAPAVGPDGSVYVINGSLHVIALDADGDVRWTAQNVVPNTALAPEVSPDGKLLVFGTEACFGGACPSRVIGLDTSDGSVVFDQPLPSVPGGVPTVRTQPRFSQDGSVFYIGADAFTAFTHSYLFAFEAGSAPWQGYCTAKTTSNGCVPAISPTGTPGPNTGAAFVITADEVPNQTLGVCFYGLNGPAAIPFQGGTLCVMPPTSRTQLQTSGGSPASASDCSGAYALDFDARIAAGTDPLLVTGATVHAQYWVRDPGDAFGTGLSDAIQFVIQP
jgi:outer membrane protein assembly factor BamB